MVRRANWLVAVCLSLIAVAALAISASAGAKAKKPAGNPLGPMQPLAVQWIPGFNAPGTPAKYNKVGILKIGRAKAKNIMIFVPGTSGGSAYIVPFAKWLVSKTPDWQVWSVERRENLLEDQSMLDQVKAKTASPQDVWNYYLGYLSDPSITKHIQPPSDASVAYAHQWGMNVAIEDIHRVVQAAQKLHGHIVLSGHSLGGTVVTAYATWDFHGKAGADDLAGLVYDDGSSGTTPPTADVATATLNTFNTQTPWLAFSGVPAPFLGLFSALGSTAAIYRPGDPSIGQQSSLLPAILKPPVPVTNLAQFGYAVDVKTSKLSFATQAHVGQLDTSKSPAGWNGAGAITPLVRYAAMLAGSGIKGTDGSEWYFPQRLTIDSAGVDEGNDNPAQQVFGEHATHGTTLPKRLLMYAFGAAGGQRVLDATTTLANQSHIPASNLTLIQHQDTYAHNDPAGAYPQNAFFDALVPFLHKAAKVTVK
jgi:hypothetical protein